MFGIKKKLEWIYDRINYVDEALDKRILRLVDEVRDLQETNKGLQWQLNNPPEYKEGKTYKHGTCISASPRRVDRGAMRSDYYCWVYSFKSADSVITTITK
jgi:hypothetical protein